MTALPSQKRIQAALDQIGAAPAKYVINTHWHWDHTDGNEWLHQQGATIIAQENTLKHLSATTRVEDWDYTFQPWPVGARPTITFKTDKTLKFDRETIVMKNFGRGHTDGDLSVYFQRADVLVLGDTFWNGIYPFIDNAAGGGIDGMIRWVDAALIRATDKTIIVPGHGPVGNKAQLVEFREMLAAIRENVYRLKKQGKSLRRSHRRQTDGCLRRKVGQVRDRSGILYAACLCRSQSDHAEVSGLRIQEWHVS